MSTKVQFALMVAYFVLAALSLYEKQPAKALYWTGAIILTSGVLLMRG